MEAQKVKHYIKDYKKCKNCSEEKVSTQLVIIVHYEYSDDYRMNVPTHVVGLYECHICGHSCSVFDEANIDQKYFLFGVTL